MDLFFCDHPSMDITATIAANLSRWMEAHPALNTLKKLASKSGVGFGTVQRAKNGSGNVTIQNLDAIATAFGRRTIDLLAIPRSDYDTQSIVTIATAQEPNPDEVELVAGFRVADPGLKRAILTLSRQAKEDFGKRSKISQ